LGGRLSVLNPAGQEIFSAGLQNARKVPGLWERQQRTLEQQRQELDRQQQAFTQMTHDLQAGEFQRSRSSEVQRLEQTIGQLRRDLDQQRRELDQQRWLIAALERQLSSLQHR
jgi:hypothetical protein